jgi:hypothetical protein
MPTNAELSKRMDKVEIRQDGMDAKLLASATSFTAALQAHGTESRKGMEALQLTFETGLAEIRGDITGIKRRTQHDDDVNEGVRQAKAHQEKLDHDAAVIADEKSDKRQARLNLFFAGWAALATVVAAVTGLYIAFHHPQNLTVNETTNTNVLEHPPAVAGHAVGGAQ